MGSAGLKVLIGIACVVIIAAGGLFVATQVKAYSDASDGERAVALSRSRYNCDKYAEEAARREKGQIHKINESDNLFRLKWRGCQEDFPGVY